MRNISLSILACLMIFSSCDYKPEQLFDKDKDPAAPVLTIEGATNFVITEDLPDFYYTVLTWSRANFGKGVSANYTLQVSNDEDFTGTVKTVEIGEDAYLRALTATELYGWAMDDFGVYNNETERKEPASLFFRILASPNYGSMTSSGHNQPVYSNVESITSQWKADEPWNPVELTIRFKPVSGDWGEYAVYAWGDAEVYGSWPGQTLKANSEGWYTITVPTNRPINMIINNNGQGRQFDFLKDPTESVCYEFEIGEDNNDCIWTAVECPPADAVELTIRFKAVSGGWDEYAVYAWGDAEVYGGWPGLILESDDDGWYSFDVPTNRPINLIINNNGNGRQFDFLKDPTESLCYEFEIDEDNNDCVWTSVDCPSGEPAMYMIGEEFGGWDWSSNGIVTMTPVNGFEGHFWAVRYISEGKGFKWCAVRDWNGDFYSLGEDIGYTTSGGNAFVAESGMYMVYVDTENRKISVEPARVYGIGDCFGGWDTALYPFEVQGQTMTRTTVGTGDLRIYAASDIAPVGGDWWRMEFVIMDGKIAYRGAGGDQSRVNVDEGKLVVLDFNTGIGSIE